VENADADLENPSYGAAAAIWAACDLVELTKRRKLSLLKHLNSLGENSPFNFIKGTKLTISDLDQEIPPEKARMLFSEVEKNPGTPSADHFMASLLLLAVWSALKTEVNKPAEDVVLNLIEDMEAYDLEGVPGTVVYALLKFLPTIVEHNKALREAASTAPSHLKLPLWKAFLSNWSQ